MIFDSFGPVITISYGATLVGLGFILVGIAAGSANPMLLYLGIFMAGQGSKGLGNFIFLESGF